MEQRRGFQSTQWSVVLRAGGALTPESRKALDELCRIYREPLLAFAQKLTGDSGRAEDLVQSFLLRFVETEMAAAADPQRGSFRAFLRTSLRNCFFNARDAEETLKRGGGVSFVDSDDTPISDGLTADRLYDRLWAQSLVRRVLGRLGENEARAGRGARFEALRDRLAGDDDTAMLRETAAALGMKEGTLKVALHRLRQRYFDCLKEEVAETVSRYEDAEDELKQLLDVWKDDS